MSGGWQHMPQHPGGYPPQPAYPRQGAYPQQEGYHPQSAYYPQGAYPPQGGYPPHGSYQEGYGQAHYGQHPSYQPQPYPSYPQPYGHQHSQYSYPQQPAAYAQPGPYPAPVAAGPPAYSQAQNLPTTQRQPINSCYNCGAPDHWAQHCPEPKREVPHGQLLESAARPAKRFRPNYIPPVVTKYPVPHHVAQQQPTPPSFTSSPSWTKPPVSTPGANGMHTPTSQVHGHNPLQQASPVTTIPDLVSAKPQFTPSQPPQTGMTETHNHGDGLRTPPYTGDHQSSAKAADSNVDDEAKPVPMSRRASTNTSVSMATESDSETDCEDYLLLDIPDMPSRIDYPDAKRPRLVEAPLPPLGESDQQIVYVAPEAVKTCTIKSQYQKEGDLDALSNNIRESTEFSALEHDPVFIRLREDPPNPMSSNSGATSPQRRDADNPSLKKHSQKSSADRANDDNIDDPDPSPSDLQRLVRKYYPDAAPQKLSRDAPPPPPPPPPPPQRYGQRGNMDGHPNSPPRSYRRQSGYSAHSPAGRVGSERSPGSGRSRKRDREEDEPHRPDGERQHDEFAPKPRRTAPKVADVYSRRW